MREAELWKRMNEVLGDDYAPAWADLVVLEDLGGRVVNEAIEAGLDFKTIWRAVWTQLELPDSLR
ncbi:MAG: DUF3046 domain-containing protein [Propionibacteriaceae bacterium]|jgi:hypothetical protein|nr:DUF3046 domain-containing protein [Propionibacteriaceae bacterium]